jgi:hypothetical protein
MHSPVLFLEGEMLNEASWLIGWRSIGVRTTHWSIYRLKYIDRLAVSHTDETWPQPNVAPLPKGFSYCRIGKVGLWPWEPALLEAGAIGDRCSSSIRTDSYALVLYLSLCLDLQSAMVLCT